MRTQGIEQGFGALLAAGTLGICLAGAAVAGDPAPAALNLADPSPLEMTHWTGSYAYLEGELQGASFQAVRMPYAAGRRSMLIVLPDANVNFGRFVHAITTRELNRWSGQLRSSFGSVSLPKVAVPDGLPARTPLASLEIGAPEAGGPAQLAGANAGFDHAFSSRPFTMTVDHPFFYAIQDNKTHELLFVGVLMDPT
jgi:serine protease inhibitor